MISEKSPIRGAMAPSYLRQFKYLPIITELNQILQK